MELFDLIVGIVRGVGGIAEVLVGLSSSPSNTSTQSTAPVDTGSVLPTVSTDPQQPSATTEEEEEADHDEQDDAVQIVTADPVQTVAVREDVQAEEEDAPDEPEPDEPVPEEPALDEGNTEVAKKKKAAAEAEAIAAADAAKKKAAQTPGDKPKEKAAAEESPEEPKQASVVSMSNDGIENKWARAMMDLVGSLMDNKTWKGDLVGLISAGIGFIKSKIGTKKTTPEPTPPEPVTPEPVTPERVAPERTTPERTTSEPTVQEPVEQRTPVVPMRGVVDTVVPTSSHERVMQQVSPEQSNPMLQLEDSPGTGPEPDALVPRG